MTFNEQKSQKIHDLHKELTELKLLLSAHKSRLLWITTFSGGNGWLGSPSVLKELEDHLLMLAQKRIEALQSEINLLLTQESA